MNRYEVLEVRPLERDDECAMITFCDEHIEGEWYYKYGTNEVMDEIEVGDEFTATFVQSTDGGNVTLFVGIDEGIVSEYGCFNDIEEVA